MIALCSSLKCQGHISNRAVEKTNQPPRKDNCIDCGQAIRWVKDRKSKIHSVDSSRTKTNKNQSMFNDKWGV